ncbi:MAG: hypothetical protein AAF389_17330 [Gemmatimonadota bacterium]
MNRTTWARKGSALLWAALMGVLIAGAGESLSAQTAEGTTITNVATATYTDANGNTYAAESGQVSVTVGFLGSLDVTSPATSTPASPSTGNTVTWTITNNGNGSDQVQIAATSSDTDVAGITGYVYNTVTYPDLATLNAQLASAGDSVPAGGSITIDVVYDVGAGEGGNPSNVEVTATSTRAGGDSNAATTVVTPDLTGTVTVAADNATIDRLPSNGTLYVESFTVTSNITGTTTLDLLASLDGTNAATLTIQRIRIDGGAWIAGAGTSTSFTSGQISTVEVEYSVDGAVTDAGSSSTLTLSATASAVGGTPSDSDDHAVTIIAPLLAVAKSVHASQADAEAGAPALATNPQPGATIWYRVAVTNSGTAPADLSAPGAVTDDFSGLPVTYAGTVTDAASAVSFDTLGEAGGVITATLASLAPGATAFFVFSVTIN